MSFTNRTSVVTDCEKELANSAKLIYVTGPGKIGLTYAQHTFVHIMAHISCSACTIQNLLILMNSSWISAYMMTC